MRILLWRLCVLAILLVASCSKSSAKPAEKTAARVVSLSPSTTEAMVAIGARAQLVGRSRYCDYPPEITSLPQVGGYVDPNLEAILALRPDLVVGARGPAGPKITEQLGKHGIATFFPATESIADIEGMIAELGARTGHSDDARGVVDKLEGRLAEIGAAVAKETRVKALLVFGIEPIVVAGPGGFADEMLRRAGATNVVEAGGAYPTLGMERILALDPDVVINAAMAEARGAERIAADAPGWSNLRAVKSGHVVAVSDETVLRPGPRVAEGIATLAHALHPNAKVW